MSRLNPSQFQLFDPGDPVPVDDPKASAQWVDTFHEVTRQAPRLGAFTGQYETASRVNAEMWQGLKQDNPFRAPQTLLDPVESGPGLFHGTAQEGLSEILPAKRVGRVGNYGISNPGVAYAAENDEVAAWAYAHNAARYADASAVDPPAGPVVYEVEPKKDDLRRDTNADVYGADDWTAQARESRSGFDVRREIRMPAPGMTGDTIGLHGVQGRLFPVEGRWYQTTRQVVGSRPLGRSSGSPRADTGDW